MQKKKYSPRIIYSRYFDLGRQGEQFVAQHIFSYQVSGSLLVNDGQKIHQFNSGDFRFIKRNQLAKFVKVPVKGGEFKSVSLQLDQDTLRDVSREYNYTSSKRYLGDPVLALQPTFLYKSYIESMMPYENLSQAENEQLLYLKAKEGVLILLHENPELKDVLFDFSEPGKIDLEKFMVQNFHFNVKLTRLAFLSGRSLATFKRDFEKIFHISPSRWLQQKRLQEAYYQIKEKGKKASDVYLDLGFEDLSHFSFAFKNAFGRAPSRI